MDRIRVAPWGLICALLLTHAVWTTAMNLGFRARVPFLDTWSANLLGIAIIVMGLLFGLGKLRPRDVGLVRSKLLAGAAFTLAFVATSQAALLAIAAAGGDGLIIVNAWASRSALAVTYILCAQLFGNALYEEMVFRGFLLLQLRERLSHLGPKVGLALALLASQALFALAHVPNRLWVSGQSVAELPGTLLMLLFIGVLFALVFLLTGNLFAVVGMHAFVNGQMLQLATSAGTLDMASATVVWASGVSLAAAWWWTRTRLDRRTTSPAIRGASPLRPAPRGRACCPFPSRSSGSRMGDPAAAPDHPALRRGRPPGAPTRADIVRHPHRAEHERFEGHDGIR